MNKHPPSFQPLQEEGQGRRGEIGGLLVIRLSPFPLRHQIAVIEITAIN
ncbi:hypothetical protein MWT34_001568 [Vibrio vulnificus]|nr:hypothetical protein [Vibrio vulnificus]